MKKNSLFTSLFCLFTVLFAVSCESGYEIVVEPVFPEAVTSTVTPGEEYVFDLEPNTDWTVSIPTDVAPYFWIQDGSQQAYTVRGEAGSATVVIGVTDKADFESHSVEVSMTMGGQTQVIGTLTLEALSHEFSLYTANVDENGSFLYSGEGSDLVYSYSETPLASDQNINLLWPAEVDRYMLPVYVNSSFDWSINTAETDSWIVATMRYAEDGVTPTGEITLACDPSNYSLEDKTGKIVFNDPNYPEFSYSYNVFLPGCSGMVRFSGVFQNTVLTFNAEGKYVNTNQTESDSYVGTVSSAEQLMWFYYDLSTGMAMPCNTFSWVKVDCTFPQSDEVLRTYQYIVTLDANENSTERSAYLVALPMSVLQSGIDPSSMFDADCIKEEYSSYYCAQISQEANVVEGSVSLSLSGSAADSRELRYYSLDDLMNNFPDDPDDAEQYLMNNLGEKIMSNPNASVYILDNMNSSADAFAVTVTGNFSDFAISQNASAWLLAENASPDLYILMDATMSQKGDVGDIQLLDQNGNTVCFLICYRNF